MFLIQMLLIGILFVLTVISLFIINSFTQINEIIKDINYKNFNISLKEEKEISIALNNINNKLSNLNNCLDSIILQLHKKNK